MQKTFVLYSDPGHGWLKVPKQLLDELGIADKISAYSYQKGAYAYLEEDADATLFAQAYEKQTGKEMEYTTRIADRPSSIRLFETYEQPKPKVELETEPVLEPESDVEVEIAQKVEAIRERFM